VCQSTSAASTATEPQSKNKRKKQSIINNHLQFSLPVPVAVGFGVPGASALLHRFKELVHESQRGVVQKGLEVVWKRAGVVYVQNALLGRAGRSQGWLRSCRHRFKSGFSPAQAVGPATGLRRPRGAAGPVLRSFKLRGITGAQASTTNKQGSNTQKKPPRV